MQTFLPYPDLRASSQLLDGPRLGKQRVETFQILRALTWPAYAWKNHPAVRMWRGFVPALVLYGVENCREWVRRGNADSVLPQLLGWTGGEVPEDPPLPPWFGLEALHLSHRSALLRKDPAYYRPLFGDEPDDLPYLWPPDTFPRWPLRRGDRDVDLAEALRLLGLAEPRPGQAEAVEALAAGRDCLLVAAPGTGGTTAGLLAGLVLPGTTRWVSPPHGPVTSDVPEVVLVAARQAAAEAGPEDTAEAGKPPALARPPSAVDLAAMRDETRPAEFLFARDVAPLPHDCSLVVLDGADRLPGVRLPDERPPALAVVPRADAAQRAELADRLGLRDPAHAGGGWDPAGTWLGVLTPASAVARRRALPGVVRGRGPVLVVTAGRERLDRVVAGLVADGLRAAGWAEGMRPSRATAAIAGWRGRRLDALVVVAGGAPPLGRIAPRVLLHVDPPADREAWRDAVAALAPEHAVVVVGPDAPADLAAYAAVPGCRRAALLAPYGEPVAVPCGRCDVCAPLPPAEAVSRRGRAGAAGPRAAPRRAPASPAG